MNCSAHLNQTPALRRKCRMTLQFIFFKSTEWRSNFLDLNLLFCRVWKEVRQYVYKNHRNRFNPKFCCNKEFRMCGISHYMEISYEKLTMRTQPMRRNVTALLIKFLSLYECNSQCSFTSCLSNYHLDYDHV
jgi:hypothetical protein